MKKTMVLGLLVILPVFGFVGCSNDNEYKVQFVFMAQNNSLMQSKNSTRTVLNLINSTNGRILDFNDFYNELGNLIGAYTPDEFVLGLGSVIIYNNNYFNYLIDSKSFYYMPINFLNIETINLNNNIEPGYYTGLIFDFNFIKGYLAGGMWEDEKLILTEFQRQDPFIKFTINDGIEKGHIFSTDVKYLTGYNPALNTIFESYDLDWDWYWDVLVSDNTYTITPDYLLPSKLYIQGYKEGENAPTIDKYIFTSNSLKYYYELTDYKELGGPEQMGGSIRILQIPFEGIYIPKDASLVKFIINWDLTNIIECYDNNTPSNFTDDFFVLARDYYSRLTLTVEIIE